MITARQIRKRAETQIGFLQKNCAHKKTDIFLDHSLGIGHTTGSLKMCIRCEKVLERYPLKIVE